MVKNLEMLPSCTLRSTKQFALHQVIWGFVFYEKFVDNVQVFQIFLHVLNPHVCRIALQEWSHFAIDAADPHLDCRNPFFALPHLLSLSVERRAIGYCLHVTGLCCTKTCTRQLLATCAGEVSLPTNKVQELNRELGDLEPTVEVFQQLENAQKEVEEVLSSRPVALGHECFNTLVMSLAAHDAPLHFVLLPILANLAQSL